MKRFMSKKVAAIGLAAGIALGAGGAAFAYFTSVGAGSGSASVGHSNDLTITQDAFSNTPPDQPAVTLYPGNGFQAINFTVANPSGGGNEYVNTVTASVASDGTNVETVDGDPGSAVVGCLASWFQVNNPVQTVGQDIAQGDTYDYTSGSLSVQLNDDATHSQDACHDVTIALHFASA